MASCPLCAKALRPRSGDTMAAWRQHLKSTKTCELHATLSRALPRCPGCRVTFSTVDEIYQHLHESSCWPTQQNGDSGASEAGYRLRRPNPASTIRVPCTAETALILRQVAGAGDDVSALAELGGKLWDSSVLLARLLDRGVLPPIQLSGANVCELGAGCGLAGMAFALHGASRVVLTDFSELVEHMNANIALNHFPTCAVSSTAYAWGTDARAAGLLRAEADHFDVVVAADCIYLCDQIGPFMDSLRQLAPTPATAVVVALEKRSTAVWEAFDEAMRNEFDVESIPREQLAAAITTGSDAEESARVSHLAVQVCRRAPGRLETQMEVGDAGVERGAEREGQRVL